MTVAISPPRIGAPLRYKALSVFPLFAEPAGDVEYRLGEEALADESILVEEVSEAGSVPDLLVENKGDSRVLFLEGEELIGAKQNRILNTSVLVAAHSKIKIPVSCVEQGRWRYKTRQLGSSGSQSPLKLRRALKSSVSASVRAQMGYLSDQSAVWEEVASLSGIHGVASATGAMSDVFDAHRKNVSDYLEQIEYPEGASGLAVAVGESIVSVDLFDKPSTCQKVWRRLLSGVVFDAMEAGETEKHASAADVERLLEAAADGPWEEAPAIGEGVEYRAQFDGDHGSALALGDTVVHGSVVTGA